MQFVSTATCLITLATLLLCPVAPASAGVIYSVTVDTSTISGTNGYIDFQFNNGGPTSQPASVTISSFSSDGGVLGLPLPSIGAVSGVLPGTVTIDNTDALNDYTHGFLFGSWFGFILVLDGPAIISPTDIALSGSRFGLALYNDSFVQLLTSNPEGDFAAIADVNLDGLVTTATFQPPSGGQPAVTFAYVPEPSTFTLAPGALLALVSVTRVRRIIRPPRSAHS